MKHKFLLIALLTAAESHAAERTFSDALTAIVAQNPALTAQQETAAAAAERLTPLGYHYLPTVSVVGENAYQAPAQELDKRLRTTSVGLDIRSNLFRFGADRAAATAAELDVKKQTAKVKVARFKLEAEAAAQLLDAITARLELDVIRKIASSRDDLLKVAKRQYSKGMIAAQEVTKIEVDLGSATARVIDAEADVARSAANLAPYLGGDAIETAWPFRVIVLAAQKDIVKPGAIDGLVAATADQPELEAARLEAAQQEQQLTAARARQYPYLDLRAGLDKRVEGEAGVPGFEAGAPRASAALVLTVPLFERFESTANYRAAAHTKAAADADLAAQQMASGTSLASAKALLKAALTTVQSREQLLVSARQLYRDNLTRFERGLVTVNEMTLDEGRLYEAELATIRGWKTTHQSVIGLCHALGKDIKGCVF